MKKAKKKQGEKDPNFQTKTNILLFLSDGQKTRGEIRDYLRDQYGIREPTTIDDHLNYLRSNGYIDKTSISRGLAISYYLFNDYASFNKLYQFLADHNKDEEFLQSGYAQNFIGEDYLRNYSKEMLLNEMTWDNYLISMTKEQRVGSPVYKEMFDKKGGNQSALSELFDQILDDPGFRHYTAELQKQDEYKDKMKLMEKISEGQFEKEYGPDAPFPSKFECNHMVHFPPKERKEIISILKSSPSAFSFLRKAIPGHDRKMKLIFYGYLLGSLLAINIDAEKNRYLADQDRRVLNDQFLDRIASELNSRQEPTMLLQVFRGMLVLDINNGKVISNEFSKQFFYRLITGKKEWDIESSEVNNS